MSAGAAEMLYGGLLTPLGFFPESWIPSSQPILVDNEATFFFAVDGILFYTDNNKVFEEGLLLTSLAGVAALMSENGSALAFATASAARGIFGTAQAVISSVNAADIESSISSAISLSPATGGLF